MPSTYLTNPVKQWLLDWAGGGKTGSGQKVDSENAISLSAFFNGVLIISESMAQLPFAPYLREKKGNRTDKRIYKEHFSFPLVARRPHPLVSAHNFQKVLYAWACRHDNGYAIIERDRMARPVSLFPCHPSRVQPKITTDREFVFLVDGREILRPMDMFHLIGFTNNGFTGQNRIEINKEQIGKAKAAVQFGSKFFGKGINVGGFIKTPKLLKTEQAVQRLKNSFVKSYGGPNNEFGVGILEDGAEWQSNELDPEKAQLNETIKMDGLTAAQVLNIPLTILKYIERGSFRNVENLAIQLVKYTLMPWAVNWEQECWQKLLTEKEKREDNIYFKYNFNGLLRGDMGAFAQFVDVMSKTGTYSPNRILELLDENGYDGGDVHPINPGAQTIEKIHDDTE